MAKEERLDKILANMGLGSRKDVKNLIKNGKVTVDGELIKDEGKKFDPLVVNIKLSGEEVKYRKYIYLKLNKPDGFLSATEDDYDPVVIDLLKEEEKLFKPYPVGRLDKDTLGLLLLTNNGELNHRLISPKWKVDKVYRVKLENPVEDDYYERIKEGVILDDGYRCLPGEMEIIDEGEREVKLTIREGKFHQVKRMFLSLGNKVTYLERIEFAGLRLGTELKRGEYRDLTKEEVESLGRITEIPMEDLYI